MNKKLDRRLSKVNGGTVINLSPGVLFKTGNTSINANEDINVNNYSRVTNTLTDYSTNRR